MVSLLRIDSSADPVGSASRKLTDAFTSAWVSAGGSVVSRDLHASPLPHLPYVGLHSADRPGVPVDAPECVLQDEVIAQVFAADALVIGAPLYNFSMPSTLKAWLDYLHVPGVTTARPGEAAPFEGKPVVVVSTRGGALDDPARELAVDHVVPVLVGLLGGAMGMAVEPITLDRTLAPKLPHLDAELAESLRVAATERAALRGRELAEQLAARV